jgi:membrane protein implicated in regulation of membrane protease activity
LALYALGFGAAAGALGLAIVLPTWAAVLIISAVFAAAAGVVFLTGRKAMRTAPKVEQTRETLKEDVRWAKQQIAR